MPRLLCRQYSPYRQHPQPHFGAGLLEQRIETTLAGRVNPWGLGFFDKE
jgi:hypothetical protein